MQRPETFRLRGNEASKQKIISQVRQQPGELTRLNFPALFSTGSPGSLTAEIEKQEQILENLFARHNILVPVFLQNVFLRLKRDQVLLVPNDKEPGSILSFDLVEKPQILARRDFRCFSYEESKEIEFLEQIEWILLLLSEIDTLLAEKKSEARKLSLKVQTAKERELTILKHRVKGSESLLDSDLRAKLPEYLREIPELQDIAKNVSEKENTIVEINDELDGIQDFIDILRESLASNNLELIEKAVDIIKDILEQKYKRTLVISHKILSIRSQISIVLEPSKPENKGSIISPTSHSRRVHLALVVALALSAAPLGLLLLKKKDVDSSGQSSGNAAPALPTSPAAVLPDAPKVQENLGEKSEAPVTVNDYIARALLRLAISNKSATISFVNEQEAAKTRQILEQDPERFIREQGCWNMKALFSVDPDGSLIYENSGRSFTVRLPAQAVPGFLAGVQKSADGSSSQAREDLAASLKVLGENCKEVRQTREAENDFFSFVLRFVLADPRLHGMITIQKDNLKEAQPFLDAITKQDVGYLIRTTENSLLLNNDNPPFADGTVALFKGPLAVNIPPYVVEGLRQGYEKHLKECAIKGEPHRKLVQASQKVRHILAEKPMSAEGDIMAKKDFCIFLLSVFLDHGNQGSSTLRFLTSPELQTRFETRQLTPEEKSRLMIQLALQADSASLSFNASGLSYIDPANNVHLTIPVGDLAGIWLPAYENALLANPNSKKYPAFYKMLEVKSEAKQ